MGANSTLAKFTMSRFSDNYSDITPPASVSTGSLEDRTENEWDYYLAAVFGDVEVLERIRAANPTINGTMHYEFPLIMATRNGRTDAVRFLLEADGGKIDGGPATSDNVWYSRCIQAANERGFDQIHAMLVETREKAEAHENSPAAHRVDERLKTPLTEGDVAGAKRLLDAHPELCAVSTDDQMQYLLWAYNTAATDKQVELVRLLIAHGIDPNAGPLIHYASEQNNVPLVRLLLEEGANPNTEVDSCSNCMWIARFANPDSYHDIHELLARYGGRIPIHHEDKLPTAEQLFAADEEYQQELYRTTEFFWIVLRSDDVETLDRFVEKFGNEQVQRNSWQKGWYGPPSIPLLNRLVEHGMNVNQRDWRGRSFIFSAPDNEWLARYIELGADLNVVEFMECSTRLGYAAFHNNLEMAQFLLAHGADPKQPTEHEWGQPLSQAKKQGHHRVVQALEEHLSGAK